MTPLQKGFEFLFTNSREIIRSKRPYDGEELAEKPLAIVSFEQPPFWPEIQRCAPNAVLRSALFKTRPGEASEEAVFKKMVVSWPGIEIKYTGFILGQPDLDVWLQTIQIYCEQNFENKAYFTGRGFLKALCRKGTGERDLEWLHSRLGILASCVVEIILNGKPKYWGKLVEEIFIDEETDRWLVSINQHLAKLFEENEYTKLDWKKRLALKSDLAKWLHGYVCSYQTTPNQPHKISIDKLRELCGAVHVTTPLDVQQWQSDLRKSMWQLETIGILINWSLENDVLAFARPNPQT